ncbi:bifunctional phosphoribosyl-AMP cyclohydrolase/phosphoribosyl-ATP diphosphatase HisIE [soil metagenome]
MKLNYDKYSDGLVPAIVQDVRTGTVLMLGFMNDEAVAETIRTGKVTFCSRSRRCLWTKGETSGNYLSMRSIAADCDNDTLLVMAVPSGPVCHTGSQTCFSRDGQPAVPTPEQLQNTIDDRLERLPAGSYIADLAAGGLNKIAQKVGEEAVELVIAAKDDDIEAFKSEAADLLFHYLVLLRSKGVSLSDIYEVLDHRRKPTTV